VGCLSCNVSATPQKKRELSSGWLEVFFNKVRNIEFSNYVIWTGGEPFLSFKSLKKGIELADQAGYYSEILTSGFWFKENPEMLQDLSIFGDFTLRISMDVEHQKKVPVAMILDLLGKALELGVDINFTVREIPGHPFHLEDILRKVEKLYPLYYQQHVKQSRWLHFIPHIPMGKRDAHSVVEKMDTIKIKRQKPVCKLGFKDLVIAEDGLLYPCCGLFNIKEFHRLAYGNPIREDWEIIEKRQSTNSFFESLREAGPHKVYLDLAAGNKKSDWLDNCVSPCQVCILLFHDFEEEVFGILKDQKKNE
jgi:MoaA/NifB/PqqE/SkfB family radical SAM enzyme